MNSVMNALGRGQPGGDAASVAETRDAIDAALAAAGGAFAGYSCKTVSWDDVSRGTVGGSLSCWGGNITDTYLKAKDGRGLFTVRSDNWNEKLGVVRATDVAMLIGNCEAAGGEGLRNVTLAEFLNDPCAAGAAYAGMQPGATLGDAESDVKVSIRFQTVFLPVDVDAAGRGTLQFAAEAYNYQTRSDAVPRNLVLLATTQGLSVQCDGAGAKRLLLHSGAPGEVGEYWLEAEQSAHKVGGEQRETVEEREDALKRGKATSEVIGLKAMGKRFNVLMTVQIPLEQKSTARSRQVPGNSSWKVGGTFSFSPPQAYQTAVMSSTCCAGAQRSPPAVAPPDPTPSPPLPGLAVVEEAVAGSGETGGVFEEEEAACMSLGQGEILCCEMELSEPMCLSSAHGVEERCEEDSYAPYVELEPMMLKAPARRRSAMPAPPVKKGKANAARVSRGDFYGTHVGLPVTKPTRKAGEHVTVTCVFYNTVAGGVPSEDDVLAAVTDMENMYEACTESGRLADAAFDFMKSELTVAAMAGIDDKVSTQAPVAKDPPATSAPPTSPNTLIMHKFDHVSSAGGLCAGSALELRLLVLGAVDARSDVRELLAGKFDLLQRKVAEGDVAGAAGMLPELKLMTRGALSVSEN